MKQRTLFSAKEIKDCRNKKFQHNSAENEQAFHKSIVSSSSTNLGADYLVES